MLAFGPPGSGKTHLLCAIGLELIYAGRRVLLRRCDVLVQELLAAKRDLVLPRLLKQWGRFDALLIDGLGYVQHSRQEMEVLFNLLAHRYERGSVLITSNLPFSPMGGDLQRPHDHRGGHRPPRPPQRDPRTQHLQLPAGGVEKEASCRLTGRRVRGYPGPRPTAGTTPSRGATRMWIICQCGRCPAAHVLTRSDRALFRLRKRYNSNPEREF